MIEHMCVNVGSGKGHNNKGDWIYVDYKNKLGLTDYIVDVSYEPLPFKNNSIDILFSSHLLEHIRDDRLNFVVSEFYRVLKPKGYMRISVPDLLTITMLYFSKNIDRFKELETPYRETNTLVGEYFVDLLYSLRAGNKTGGHINMFDYDMLWKLFNEHGFVNIKRSSYMNSDSTMYVNVGMQDVRPNISMFVEAWK